MFLALPRPVRIALAIIAATIALSAAAALWLRFHDAKIVDRHETGVAAAVASQTAAANDAANANDAKRQVEDAKAQTRTEEAMRRAQNEHPAEAAAPAGPVTRAVADSLRARSRPSGAPAR